MLAPIDRSGPKWPTQKVDLKPLDDAQFDLKDANHDGGLSKDEFVSSRSGLGKLLQGVRFAQFDRDHDGKVTKEEFHAGLTRERKMERLGTGGWGRPNGPIGVEMAPVIKEGLERIFAGIKALFGR